MKVVFLTLLIGLASSMSLALPSTVIITRHAEKPDSDSDTLSEKGFQRASAMAHLFEIHPELPVPVEIFALSSIGSHGSFRAIETVTPLAQKLNLTVQTPYPSEQYASLANDIMTSKDLDGKTVMIAWKHTYIPGLARAFGVPNVPTWKSEVFDRLWIITFTNGQDTMQATMVDVPQSLLPGDSK